MSRVINVTGLVAGYGGVPVVHGIDLHVDEGEVVTLLGPNGAGKTTTVLTISGVLPSIAGTIEVMGSPIRTSSHVVARRGYVLVPEDRGLFAQLTVAENLRLRTRGQRDTSQAEILSYFPALKRLLRRRAGVLSGGEQQMLALAGAMASRPRVLVLDEMSHGLAPIIVQSLLPIVRTFAKDRGIGVLLVEQHVHSALLMADRAYVLNGGRIVLEGEAALLAAQLEQVERSYLGPVESLGSDARVAARVHASSETLPYGSVERTGRAAVADEFRT